MQLLSCGFVMLIFVTINVECLYLDLKQFHNDPWRGVPMLCSSEDPANVSISCHGVRLVKRVIQQLLERAANVPNIEIIDGISLVDSIHGSTKRARTLDNSILGFFEDRELRVKLSVLMPHILDFYTTNYYSDVSARGQSGLNFGGGKKGGNNFFYLALMMGKMLFVLGFSTLAFVSMKALMASSLALMLSLIVAAKKYASSSGSGGGGGGGSNDGGYHVVYAHEGHHEKRSIDNIELSPYRGWINNRDSIKLDLTR